MRDSVQHAFDVEAAFLTGVRANLQLAGGRYVAGAWFDVEERDQAERVRAAMVDRRLFDRERFNQMPRGRTAIVRGWERRWFFGKKLKSVTIATVVAPPGPLLEGSRNAPPIGLSQIRDHLRELRLDGRAPHLIGVCSPTGFDDEVRRTPIGIPNVTLVLVEPGSEGGWRVSSPSGRLDERLTRLFDPEGVSEKIARVKRVVEEKSTHLLVGGLTAEDLARSLDLSPRIVETAFETITRENPELRVSRQSGEVLLFRGARVLSEKEDDSMSLADWIRSLFSNTGDEAKKINVLSERRAALSARLDRLYDDIGKLEKKEDQLVAEGKAATSQVSKRRLAAQIAHMRKDISRANTSAAMLSKQINIISTHIHNLELAQTGSVAQLPTSDELTEAAVNAEEILEQLSAGDALVASLEVGLAQTAVSEDEAAILKELEGEKHDAAPAKEQVVMKTPEMPTAARQKERGPAQAE